MPMPITDKQDSNHNLLNSKSKMSPRALVFSMLCGAIGALLNFFPFFLFSDLTLIFGPALSILVALSVGPWCGALAAAIASISLVFSWGHYYGFLLFMPEALFVGYFYRRGWNELIAVLVYWLIVAIPFVYILVFVREQPGLAFDLSIKYLINSFLYTLIASALLWFFSVPKWLKLETVRTYSLRTQIFTVLMASMTIPIAAISLYNGQKSQQELVQQIQVKLQENTQRVSRKLDSFIQSQKILLQNQANILALSSRDKLYSEQDLQQFHQQHPEFISMLIASPNGDLTALSSMFENKEQLSVKNQTQNNINDRDYFHAAMIRRTYVSEAFISRPNNDPIITISTPVVSPSSNHIIAVLAASVNLYQFDRLLVDQNHKNQLSDTSLLLLDADKKVIFSSSEMKLDLLHSLDLQQLVKSEQTNFYTTKLFDERVISASSESLNNWKVNLFYPISGFNQLSQKNYRDYAMILSVIILFVGFLAVFLSYQINAPIQLLFRRVVNFNLTRKDQKKVELSPLVAKEIAVLIRAHESAEKRLRDSFQTEQLHLQKRITAEKANEAKSNFLSAMSHELRTPLNAISGFSQLLVLEDSLNKESQELVGEIDIASQHLMLLINDILDMSKIESGNLLLNIEPVDIAELLETTLPMLANQAHARDITMELQPSTQKIFVLADRLRLKQVTINLLSNAIKYNHSGGMVTISLEKGDSQSCTIRVSDTGVGIAPEKLNELFKQFNRLDKENSDIDGYGIGLVISKKLLELMGGQIKVESEVKKGSSFCISLPTDNLTVASQKKSPQINTNNTDSITACRILYVEDNDVNAMVMQKALQRYSAIDYKRAPSGKVGLKLLQDEFFDLVLLDISLPDMNGYDILKVMQKELRGQYRDVFAVSANAMSEDINQGMAAGFDEYVTKPVKFEELFELIRAYQLK